MGLKFAVEPPQTRGSLPTGHLPLAGRARRFGSLLYEALLVVAIVFVVSFMTLPLVSPASYAAAQALTIPSVPQRMALFCILFAAIAWYFIWSWSGGRRTLPMKTWRLRLAPTNGEMLTIKVATLRYLAAWIGPLLAVMLFALLNRYQVGAHAMWLLGLNFLWAFIDRDGQFLHDRLAGTRIVLERPVVPHSTAPVPASPS